MALRRDRGADPKHAARWLTSLARRATRSDVSGCPLHPTAGAGFIAAGVPFVGSMAPSERARALGAPVEVDPRPIAPGALVTVEWRGKPVWVLRRTPAMLKGLQRDTPLLADPESVAVCTHLGCIPTYRPVPAGAPDLGFALAYPSNVWMVKQRLKHGLMTSRTTRVAHETALQANPGRHAGASGHVAAGSGHGACGSGHGPGGAHGAAAHGSSGGHGGSGMKTNATVPQLAAVGGVSALALAAGMVAPANWVNMTLSARDVGGAIMPPGMIMDRDTPAEAMRDMAAVHPREVTARHGLDAKGGRELTPRLEGGVKVFDLETTVVRWTILPGISVDAYTYNDQVPGPRIRIREGDRVRITVTNRLPESTTVHWHGPILPNAMEGPAHVTQEPIETGSVYRYEFTAAQSGTYFYHSHDHVDRQQALGLYGALIIDPAEPDPALRADHEYTLQLQEWLLREGLTYPAMPMDGGQPNYFTINGRAWPATDTIRMRVGETLKVRFVGSNSGFIHPMHIHGGPFVVVARDGETLPLDARFKADTINVGPGQRYDVIWTALRPGKWLIHCHVSHHTTNNNVETKGGGGLMMMIDVAG